MAQNESIARDTVEVKASRLFQDERWRKADITSDILTDLPMAIVSLLIEAYEDDSRDSEYIVYYLIIGPPEQGRLPIRMGVKHPDEGWFIEVAGFDAYELRSIEDGDEYEVGDAISNALSDQDGEALVSALTETKGDWLMIRKVQGNNE